MKKDYPSKARLIDILELSLFEFDDYRAFLSSLYIKAKAYDKKHSFRYWSQHFRFRSPNFLKLIIDRERHLSFDSLNDVSQALLLNPKETQYLRAMFSRETSLNIDDKLSAAKKAKKMLQMTKVGKLHATSYDLYSEPILVALRELVGTSDFRNDPTWIRQRLRMTASCEKIEEGLKILCRLGLIVKDQTEKGFRQDQAQISTEDEVSQTAVLYWHHAMLEEAQKSLIQVNPKEREVTGFTCSLSKKGIERARKLARKMMKEFFVIAAEDQANQDDEVVHVALQLFPLSKRAGA